MIVRPKRLFSVLTHEIEPNTSIWPTGFSKTLEPILDVTGDETSVSRHVFVRVCERDERVIFILSSLQHYAVSPFSPLPNATGDALPAREGIRPLNKWLRALHQNLNPMRIGRVERRCLRSRREPPRRPRRRRPRRRRPENLRLKELTSLHQLDRGSAAG